MPSIRSYNSETGKWETVASSEATELSTSSPEFLLEGEERTSVNNAMLRINDKISKLERNVSWLALHGGGGSGGGGLDDSIKITNSDIVNENGVNTLYLNSKSITLNYLITSKNANSRFFIDLSLDGNSLISQQEGWSSVPGKLEIPDITRFSKNGTHSIVVTANSLEGDSVIPYLLTVVESNVELKSSVNGVSATIGLEYLITYSVVNKVSGSDTSLIVTNITNGVSKTYELGKFTSSDPVLYDVNFFNLFTDTPTSGSSYTIEAKAQTSLNGNVIESNVVTNKVVVEDGNSLVVLIDGCTTEKEVEGGTAPTEFTHGGNISFSFTPYLSGVSIVYYAIKLECAGETFYSGIFDPSGEPGDRYSDNQYTQKGKLQVFSYSIPIDKKYIGNWKITLRCWSEKGNPILDTPLSCKVVESSSSLIEDQNPNNARYAKWNIKDTSFPGNPIQGSWKSVEEAYIEPGTGNPNRIETVLKVYNTNGESSGFLIKDNQSKLRLSSRSYGEIELSPFKDDVFDNGNWSKVGFSFSVTFKADYHPYEDGVVFMIGDYDTEGLFNEGILVTLEDVIWSYTDGLIKNTISAKIQQEVLNTIDFIVDKNKKEVKIFINGILNAAREIRTDFTWKSNSKFYLAHSYNKGGRSMYCDVDFYDIKLFRYPLNDKQVVINYMNSDSIANLKPDGTIDFTSYNSKKLRNFFSASDNSANTSLWDDFNNTYANITFDQLISDSNRKSPLPVVYIDCNGSGFTKSVYEAIGANKNEYKGCTLSYFDPESGKSNSISTSDVSVMIQGTSTTGYRSKNLEIIFRKILRDEQGGEIGQELFQPKDTWMPEGQYTLKADVVDSAHANNAAIGKWINDNADLLFEKTPPMKELEAHRPVDTKEPGKKHEKVTIKHTLEGFPIILLVKFDQTDVQEFLGIYSFNLGRGSYYNMGFKFLKSFTTKIKGSDGSYKDTPAPAFVTDYEVYSPGEKFGNITQSQIFSYEFGENANLIEEDGKKLPLALFWQDDLSIIKKVGEFKYNGQIGDASNVTDNNVWERLQLLFTDLAKMTSTQVDRYRWDDSTKKYVKTGGVYNAETSWSTLADDLSNRLSLKNAYSYFIISVAFGLVDSLGKNMTLRSWNCGGDKLDPEMNKWYPCFYDMDTANGLSNTGEENVPKTAYIDTFYNAPADQGGALQVNMNDGKGGYGTYSSRLWNVLRDSIFINTGVYTDGGYNELWDKWRNVDSLIKNFETFINDYFAFQLRNCGELIYNYDYRVKYLTRYSKDEGEDSTYANIEFLHGNRINYVRDWLKKRFIFMDGVFHYSNEGNINPYNNKGAFKCGGASSGSPVLKIKTNTPFIFTVNIGQISGADKRFFVEENKETEIVLNPISSYNTQITINGMDVVTEIMGLREMKFQGFMTSMKLPSLSSLALSGTDTLSSSPILFESMFIGKKGFSELRDIDLSNTKFWSGNSGVSTFIVDLEKYSKLNTLDISRSCVTSLSLPNSPLSRLKVSYSVVEILTIKSQPFIDSIDLTGCTKLKKIVIQGCPKIKSLNLSRFEELQEVEISTCSGLTEFICESNPKLVSLKIINSPNIEKISLKDCSDSALSVDLSGASSALKDLSVTGVSFNVIPLSIYSVGIEKLNISGSQIKAIQYGSEKIPEYEGVQMLDLTRLTKLESSGLTISDNTGVEYIKFDNNSEKPFEISKDSIFKGCANLKRVFGHLKFNTAKSSFHSCREFFIHPYPSSEITPMPEPGKWFGTDTKDQAGKDKWSKGEGLDTNITLGETATSLDSFMYTTSGNLYDLYYILQKCDNVTSLSTAFFGCKNIEEQLDGKNILNRKTFEHCSKVTSLYHCFPIKRTVLYSNSAPGVYDGTLSYLKSLITYSQVFRNVVVDENLFSSVEEGKDYFPMEVVADSFTSMLFVKDASKVTDVSDEALTTHYTYVDSGKFFGGLKKLRTVERAITGGNNYCGVELKDMTIGDGPTAATFTNLFYEIPNLTKLLSSFNFTYKGTLKDPFGGHSRLLTLNNKFPRNLGTIENSICNKSSIECEFILDDNTFNGVTKLTKLVYRDGNGYSKSFQGFQKVVRGNQFPYNIFARTKEITDVSGFFEDLKVELNNGGNPIELPGTLFTNNTKLEYVEDLFKNFGGKYKMTGFGFKNCKLRNCRRLFYEDTVDNSTDTDLKKEGSIPYGLLYMDYTTLTSKKGWNVEDATTDQISESFGIDEHGEWIPDEELVTPMPPERSYNFNVTKIRRSIENAEYLIRGLRRNAKYYTQNVGNLSKDNYGDLLEHNEYYNPVKYIRNPKYDPVESIKNPNYDPDNPEEFPEFIPNPNRDIRRVILNKEYSPYEYIWNYWCLDGSSVDMASVIKVSSLYEAVKNKEISVSEEIPEANFQVDPAPTNSKIHSSVKGIANYSIPSDIFRYCVNSGTTKIGYSLSSFGNPYWGSPSLKGRLSRFIFTPLTKITDLKGIFYYTTFAPYSEGNMYPPTLFSSNTALKSIDSMFYRSWVVDSTTIPTTLLSKCYGLTSANQTWNLCLFLGTGQVPSSMFKSNSSLTSVIGTFSSANISGIGDDNIAITDGLPGGIGYSSVKGFDGVSLLSPTYNPNLRYVSAFLSGCEDFTGSVPEFWNFKKMDSKIDYNTFSSIKMSKVENIENVPEEWKSKMVNDLPPEP